MSSPTPESTRRMSEDGPDTSKYPAPLIVEPTSEHKESWIVLHGRGDKAATFARGRMGFLNMIFPDGRTIQQHLPHVRFVFPTASYRRARVFNRSFVTQWFDIYSWNNTDRMEWQVQGLRETTAWISELVRRESEIVGAHNVVVGGLSQGCASVLVWNLLQNQEKVKCVFGMSGWMPFRHVLELYLPEAQNSSQTDGDVVFEGQESSENPYTAAVKALYQELQLEPIEANLGQVTPLFLGHGAEDERVDTEQGLKASQCLLGLSCNVKWVEYSGLGHWFHGRELMDIVQFVSEQTSTEPEISQVT